MNHEVTMSFAQTHYSKVGEVEFGSKINRSIYETQFVLYPQGHKH